MVMKASYSLSAGVYFTVFCAICTVWRIGPNRSKDCIWAPIAAKLAHGELCTLIVAGYPYNQDHYYPDFLALPDSRHVIFRAGPYQSGISCSLYGADLAASGGITIQRLVRGDVPVGSAGFLLAIDGANFVPGTSVEWNGQIRPATFVSDRRINVPIEAADLAAAGPIAVRAVTPGNDHSNVVFSS
jgi:hypothetical protein